MNQDTIKLLIAKVEKTLEITRILKSEKSDLEATVESLQENLREKDKEIEEFNATKEQLLAEIRSLQDALNERDSKLNDSENALLHAIESLNKELGIENTDSSKGFF